MILIGFLIWAGIFVFASYILPLPSHIEDVDCYDRNYNVIQGVTCDEKVYDKEWMNSYFDPIILLMLFLLFLLIGLTFIVKGAILLI